MHIGIHVTSLPTQVFIERLISGLVKQGHQVTVFGTVLNSYNRVPGAKYVGFKLHSPFNWSKLWLWIKSSFVLSVFNLRDKKRLDNFLSQETTKNTRHNQATAYPILVNRPDILHVQWVKGIEQFQWVQDFEIKLVTSLRGSHISMTPFTEPEIQNSYMRTFPKLDGVHSVCNYLVEESKKFGLRESVTEVIYSGVKMNEYPFSTMDRFNKQNSLRLISVGRKSWIKGYHIAIDACAILKQKRIDFDYKIVGFEKDEELIFRVHQSGIQNQVKFEPWLEQSELKEAIQSADILLLPSLTEGIANVAIEAMALGTLVVASNCGGMNELIDDKINGFLHQSRNSKDLAETIEQAMNLSMDDLTAMQQEARKTVEKHFDLDNNILKFEQFYRNTLAT